MTSPEPLKIAIEHLRVGQIDLAESLLRQILSQSPNHPDYPDALHYLGIALKQKGQIAQSIELIQKSLAIRPDSLIPKINLALILQEAGQYEQAVSLYLDALSKNPPNPDQLLNSLGNSYKMLEQYESAVEAYNKAFAINPRFAQAWYNLAISLSKLTLHRQAADAYLNALAIDPNLVIAHNNLGNCLNVLNRHDDAIEHFKAAIRIDPTFAAAHNNLGLTCRNMGLLDQAIDSFKNAVRIAPDQPDIRGNLIQTLHYSMRHSPEDILHEQKLWNALLPVSKTVSVVDRNPIRRLRVGFVSPHFADHPVTRFIQPLLQHLDPAQFEIFAFHDAPASDSTTLSIRSLCQNWRNTTRLTHEQFVRQVQSDQIDILLDLASHTDHNRLQAFAQKAAPIQVTWLAYCASTGLAAMDYRISDPWMDPPGMFDRHYSEKTALLPDCYWCYQSSPFAPEPRYPAGLTLGSFNSLCKINDAVLSLWARILKELHDAKLLFVAPDASCRPRILEFFGARGVDPSRIRLVASMPTPDYYALYNQVHIALDPFPFNGGTTTCDALYMGVPVVSRVWNDRAVGRAGLSLLSQVGLSDLAAFSDEDYVNAAIELAKNTPRLRNLRANLRSVMQASPLMNAPRFAKNFGELLRHLWTNHNF